MQTYFEASLRQHRRLAERLPARFYTTDANAPIMRRAPSSAQAILFKDLGANLAPKPLGQPSAGSLKMISLRISASGMRRSKQGRCHNCNRRTGANNLTAKKAPERAKAHAFTHPSRRHARSLKQEMKCSLLWLGAFYYSELQPKRFLLGQFLRSRQQEQPPFPLAVNQNFRIINTAATNTTAITISVSIIGVSLVYTPIPKALPT